MAETGRDTGDIDVMSHGWNALFDMDMMGTYTDLTGLLPNAEGKFSEINGLDSEGYALAYWGRQSGIAYDLAKVEEANWAANPEKFGFNYQNGGSGPSF